MSLISIGLQFSSNLDVMEARRVSEAPTIKANFAPGVLQRSVSLPDIWRPPTREYFTHDKQDTVPPCSRTR